jgi:hypothetical protein
MATLEDDGRLYARVSDVALADELGMSRMTIARATERLSKDKSIAILEIPEELTAFRDSHGRFSGTKIYLIAGDIQSQFLEKSIEKADRAIKSSTVKADNNRATKSSMVVMAENVHRVTKSSTVDDHRASEYSRLAPNSRTNIIDEDDEEEERTAQIDQVFTYFAQRKGDPQYNPTNKEQGALQKLLTDGFTIEQIIAGIEVAFSRPSRPRHFTHCAAIARDLVRLQQESRTLETRTQPETLEPEALERTDQPPAETLTAPVEIIETALARAVGVYRSAGREITGDLLARFRLMAARCDPAARVAGVSGGDWLADALTSALGVARPGNLLNYADAVLNDWVANGRSEKTLKPAARSRSNNRKTPGRSREPGVNQGIIDYLEKHGGMPHGDPD